MNQDVSFETAVMCMYLKVFPAPFLKYKIAHQANHVVFRHMQNAVREVDYLAQLNILIVDITKTCLYNFDPLKSHFYIVKGGLQE